MFGWPGVSFKSLNELHTICVSCHIHRSLLLAKVTKVITADRNDEKCMKNRRQDALNWSYPLILMLRVTQHLKPVCLDVSLHMRPVRYTQRAWAMDVREGGEKKKGSVIEGETEGWVRRVRLTSFTAARGVPAMLTHSIHLLSSLKRRQFGGKGVSASTFILLHRIWAQQIQGASNSKTQINEGSHLRVMCTYIFPIKRAQIQNILRRKHWMIREKNAQSNWLALYGGLMKISITAKHFSLWFMRSDYQQEARSGKHTLGWITREHQKMPHRRFLSPFLFLNSINPSSVLLCEWEPQAAIGYGQWISTPSASGVAPVWDNVSTGSFIRLGLRASKFSFHCCDSATAHHVFLVILSFLLKIHKYTPQPEKMMSPGDSPVGHHDWYESKYWLRFSRP